MEGNSPRFNQSDVFLQVFLLLISLSATGCLAEPTDPQEMLNLAKDYLGDKDYTEAVKWFRKAGEQGHTEAQIILAALYYKGLGETHDYQDHNEAPKWAEMAAEHGSPEGQFLLGSMYGLGKGLSENKIRGYMWLFLSHEGGYKESAKMLDALARVMTRNEIAVAETLAHRWQEEHR